MPSGLTFHNPIFPIGTLSGNSPKFLMDAFEASGQIFKRGAVVMVNKTAANANEGFVQTSVASTASTQVIAAGVTALPGRNYASPGQGASPLFAGIGFPGGAGAIQDVPNQPQAYSIYKGAPYVDGLAYVYQATPDTIFKVQVDNSTAATYNYSGAANPIGSTIALNIDANGYWYADLANTAGTFADVVIVGFNELDLVPGSINVQQNFGHIYVVFNQPAIQTWPQ